MIKDWFNDSYFDPFEGEWTNRPGRYKIDPNYMSMTLDDFITEKKLNDDKNFLHYAAKHHVVPWHTDGYDLNKLNTLLDTYKKILKHEAQLDAKKALENDNPTGIANPAEYMSSVTKTEEDTNGDGNIDKVTIEKEEE